MRPALKAGLRPLWRDRDTLQIGVDPRRAIALTSLGKAAAVLSLLDGSRDAGEVARVALEYGISPAATERVLGLLASAGVLDDFALPLHKSLPDSLRARLRPELACASLAYGDTDGGARTISRRRAAFVRVYGAGRVGACVAALLAASGVARVSCRDDGDTGYGDLAPGGLGAEDIGVPRAAGAARAVRRAAPEARVADDTARLPTLAVLAGLPGPLDVADLMESGVPHLAVRADEAIGVVGPLVTPGRSACLRCIDLAKAARDPAWPLILAQTERDSPRACGTVLAAATAALAAAQALSFIDAAGPPPVIENGTLEIVLPDWQWRRRTWPPNAACACGAAGHADQPQPSGSLRKAGLL
jgi:bacteriocin biosynthesis cyclodehydratase domain-containing protein